jgi:hypothetical protein
MLKGDRFGVFSVDAGPRLAHEVEDFEGVARFSRLNDAVTRGDPSTRKTKGAALVCADGRNAIL